MPTSPNTVRRTQWLKESALTSGDTDIESVESNDSGLEDSSDEFDDLLTDQEVCKARDRFNKEVKSILSLLESADNNSSIDILFAGKIRNHTREIARIFGDDRKDLKDLLLTLEVKVFTLTQAIHLAEEREEELKIELADVKRRFEDLMEDDMWQQYKRAEMKDKLGDAWRIIGEKEEEMKELEETYETRLKEMQQVHKINNKFLRDNCQAKIKGQAETYDGLLKELQGSHEADNRILRERYEGEIEVTKSQYKNLQELIERLQHAAIQDNMEIRNNHCSIGNLHAHISNLEEEKVAIVETTNSTIAQIKKDAILVTSKLERDLKSTQDALNFSKQTSQHQAQFIRDISTKYGQMRGYMDTLEKDIRDESAAKKAEVEALKKANEELNAQLAAKDEDLNRVIKDRNSLAEKLDESEKRLFTAEATCEDYQIATREKDAIIHDFEARAKVTNDLMWEMSASNEALEQACESAEENFDAIKEVLRKVVKLKEDLGEYISKNLNPESTTTDEDEYEYDDVDEDGTLPLDACVGILVREIKKGNAEIQNLKEQVDSAIKHIADTNTRFVKENRMVRGLKETLRFVEIDKERFAEELEDARWEISNLTASSVLEADQNASIAAALQDEQFKVSVLKKISDEFENQVRDLEAKVYTRDIIIEQQENELDRQKDTIEQQENELDRQKDTIELLDGMVVTVRTALREKEIKIAAVKESFQDLVERSRAVTRDPNKLIDI